MKASAAVIDITPPPGVHLAGSGIGEHRPAQSILDPIFARVAVFEQGARRMAIVTLDTTAVSRDYAELIRDAAERLDIPREAVMVHSLQNHSAPSCGAIMLDPDLPLTLTREQEYLTGSETAYCQRVTSGVAEALNQAVATLRPVVFATGRALRDDLAFNRRAVTRSGSVRMGFPRGEEFGPLDVSHMEGPMDPEIAVFAARLEDEMDMPLFLLHHTCHPVNAFVTARIAVSADWPGAWISGMTNSFGPRTVPLVLNGCCGNINPWPVINQNFTPDHRRMGNELTRTSRAIASQLRFAPAERLDWRRRVIELDYREIPPERSAEVEEILGSRLLPVWRDDDVEGADPRWFLAASTKSVEFCRKREPTFPYEIQVFRVGDVAIVGLPGEPFVEGQLEIKLKSPAKFTLVAHMCNQYAGYLPTKEGYARGGHEADKRCLYWAKLAADSLDRVVVATLETLEELFDDART